MTIPGSFYSLIKDRFPVVTQRPASTFGMHVANGEALISNDLISQFRSKSNSCLIQLSSQMLTVNQVSGYTSWEDFFPNIVLALKSLEQVLKIDQVVRFGLKYINKLESQEHSFENFRRILNLQPLLQQGQFPYEPSSIQLNMEFAKVPKKEVLATTIATLNPEPPIKAPILFELYYVYIEQKEYNRSFILDWLETTAHSGINAAFESFLREEFRKTFDPIV